MLAMNLHQPNLSREMDKTRILSGFPRNKRATRFFCNFRRLLSTYPKKSLKKTVYGIECKLLTCQHQLGTTWNFLKNQLGHVMAFF